MTLWPIEPSNDAIPPSRRGRVLESQAPWRPGVAEPRTTVLMPAQGPEPGEMEVARRVEAVARMTGSGDPFIVNVALNGIVPTKELTPAREGLRPR
jgi:hypothetical protein